MATIAAPSIFHAELYPADSYTPEGTYWADLPFFRRLAFVTSVDREEAVAEAQKIRGRSVWANLKGYLRDHVLTGIGLGLEGYVLFSIGNLAALFESVWPSCWKTLKECPKQLIDSVTYLEVLGITVGQLLIGVLGDWIGRRFGLLLDAAIMLLGLILLTASWGTSLAGWVVSYAIALFIYGVGVGGEYPMTATLGMENAVGSGRVSSRSDRLHRGRKVTSAFLMQGWGQFLNQVILVVVLLITSGGRRAPDGERYSEAAAQWTFRISFALPAMGTAWLLYYRTSRMKSAGRQLSIAKSKARVTGYDTTSLRMTFSCFGPRVVATAGAWFCNDVFFYGNKLFQSKFISVINSEKDSVMQGWHYNLINVSVSMVGYYLASFLIDNKLYGRRKMQTVGFMLTFILFAIPAFNYKYFTSKVHITSFQAIYFLSSFFNQFGPNTVTFLVAAEVYPTPIRATAHGFSAAIGKIGALLVAVLYNYIGTQTIFKVVPWFALSGALITWIFLPDTTGLDLKEQERRWACIRAGRAEDYHGVAVHPHHLSLWERWHGVGRSYSPELDSQQKIEEMRKEWLEARRATARLEVGEELRREDGGKEDGFSTEISAYFETTEKSDMLISKSDSSLPTSGGSRDEP
ncbi:hypothetical protein GP486_000350 [Trichoglossum hirsutum]|uniref:Major facilitator superfamily (MFS) profile domain-containing protein n=1 Tax=Trichoglossum hirsutum TaxID=265104 RepID=A0A9P8RU17_9PEZI|nr:hypothetical protein GP486_000350 [Trichoglossum hirsutum]